LKKFSDFAFIVSAMGAIRIAGNAEKIGDSWV
jgi:hypothetical protein